jgi:hypothetical protein
MKDQSTELSFSQALELLKQNLRVQRTGWNGKGMWVELANMEGAELDSVNGNTYPLYSYLVMKTADNKLVPWLASQTDILANDWQLATN